MQRGVGWRQRARYPGAPPRGLGDAQTITTTTHLSNPDGRSSAIASVGCRDV